MARARNIKPGFYQNEDLAECSVWARYIFPGLWMMADREGRLEYRPKKIKGELLRFDSQDAEPLLRELQKYGFIEIYEVGGREYIQIVTFSKHQNPHHREAKSEIPAPPSPGLDHVGNPPKPEADESCQGCEAQGKPRESPGNEDENPTCEGGLAVLIPDSGFSDSLIPDSGSPSEEQSPLQTEVAWPAGDVSAPISRSVEIAVYLRQRGVTGANSFNPNISAWSDDVRVTNEILDAAIAKAKVSLGAGSAPGVNYLATIIPDLLNPKPVKPKREASIPLTAMTDAQRDEVARKLGIGTCRPGEHRDAFIARIRAKQAETEARAA